ncbi:hypothetical protein HY993_04420 [Candidatus Micrarchaeota archaeon]|nr:hypothetical protein [Candidatus Micrarchaeota archaeon]
MKRGFFYTIMAASMFFLLLSVSTRIAQVQKYPLTTDLLSSNKINYVFDDVGENLFTSFGAQVQKQNTSVIVYDYLPTDFALTSGIKAYANFTNTYYNIGGGLNISFLDENQSAIGSQAFDNTFSILPYQLNYSYANKDLAIRLLQASFHNLSTVYYNLNFTTHWFEGDVSDKSCNFWSSYKACTGGTVNCLNLTLNFVDKNGTEYSSACNQFDADKKSKLIFDLRNETDFSQFALTVGSLKNLLSFDFEQAEAVAYSNFTFNSNNFYIHSLAYLKVADLNANFSKIAGAS